MPSTPDTSVLSRHNDADPSLVAGLEEQLGGGRPQVRKQVRLWTRGLVDPLINRWAWVLMGVELISMDVQTKINLSQLV